MIGLFTFGDNFGCLENQPMHLWIAAAFGKVKGVAVIGAQD